MQSTTKMFSINKLGTKVRMHSQCETNAIYSPFIPFYLVNRVSIWLVLSMIVILLICSFNSIDVDLSYYYEKQVTLSLIHRDMHI